MHGRSSRSKRWPSPIRRSRMKTQFLADTGVSAELLLQLFDMPVSFHRCLVPIAGGVTGALMLSQAIWTTQELGPASDGWFMKSQKEWTEETGLSRWEQQTAR